MTYQRHNKVRRHPHRGRSTAQHFQSPIEVNHLQKRCPCIGFLKKNGAKRELSEKGNSGDNPMGCIGIQVIVRRTMCIGAGATESGCIRRLNKQVKILRMGVSLLSEKGVNKSEKGKTRMNHVEFN